MWNNLAFAQITLYNNLKYHDSRLSVCQITKNSSAVISLDATASVINHLIDKLSSAAGWLVTHDTPKRIAQNQYISEISASNLDPLLKASLISNAKRDIKHYRNQSAVVSAAEYHLLPNSRPQDVQDEWVDIFMDKVRFVSTEELQTIWARILAEECNSPGAIPLHLLSILSVLSKHLAESFLTLCGFTFFIDNKVYPFIDIHHKDFYSKYNLTFEDIQDLAAIGLINIDTRGYSITFHDDGVYPSGFDLYIDNKPFKCKAIAPAELNVGHVIFTHSGRALYKILSPTVPEEFTDFCLEYWRQMGHLINASIIPADEAKTAAEPATND